MQPHKKALKPDRKAPAHGPEQPAPAPAPAVVPEFAELHDDPAEAEELEREQDT